MKSIIKTLFLIFVILSSCQDDSDLIRTDMEIAQLLQIDNEFQAFFIASSSAQLLITENLLLANDQKLSSVKNSDSFEEVINALNLENNLMQ